MTMDNLRDAVKRMEHIPGDNEIVIAMKPELTEDGLRWTCFPTGGVFAQGDKIYLMEASMGKALFLATKAMEGRDKDITFDFDAGVIEGKISGIRIKPERKPETPPEETGGPTGSRV
jgi:hypothetical protein